MKNNFSLQVQQGLLAWAINRKQSIKHVIEKGYPIHMLTDHIKNHEDTKAFMAAFNDERFGQDKDIFIKGPRFWKNIPNLRKDWAVLTED